MKLFHPFVLLVAALLLSYSAFAQQTIVINAIGVVEKDPELYVIEVTLSNQSFDFEGLNTSPKSISEYETAYLLMLRQQGIPSSTSKKSGEVSYPASDFSGAYTIRKYILTLTNSEHFNSFSQNAYSVTGLTYILREATVLDVEALRRQAYTLAVADANARAEHLAAVTAMRLGELLSVEDLSSTYSPIRGYYYESEYGWDGMPSKCSYTATLKLTYAVRK